MKRILTTLSQKWPEYLLEVLVITIGIYGAFALDSWNEARKDRIEERAILENLHKDLETTITEFQFLNSLREVMINASYRIYEISSKPEDYNKEELDSLIGITLSRPTYNGKMGSLELLFSTGKISLLQNEELKSKLISWPGLVDDLKEEELYANDYYSGFYIEKIINHTVVPDLMGANDRKAFFYPDMQRNKKVIINPKVMKSEYDQLLTDKQFLNQLALRTAAFEISFLETNTLIDKAIEMQKLIKRGLN